MTRVFTFALGFLMCQVAYSSAADLAKIDRTIGKLPAFTADEQEYCLLVFGPEARERVWLVHDGPVLYVDRNGNGDLTEPEDRVTADEIEGEAEGEYSFKAGDIADGSRRHKDLNVSWNSLDHLRNSMPELREALARKPKFRGCSVDVDVDLPNLRGNGLGGRVSEGASAFDNHGLLEFAACPADAPIIHFGGAWEITLFGAPEPWRIGRTQELILVVGTPGVGPGTTANVLYKKVIPANLDPQVRVTFPPASPGQEPVVKSYVLTERCCGVNLYGKVAVPESIGTGTATVEISLESWPGAFVAPTTHQFEIVPRKPGPKLEPVSQRLVGNCEHHDPRATISGVRFSPDGKFVMAGSYTGGIIHVWEVASGNRLATFDAGEGGRATDEYFMPSADWKTLYAWQETRKDVTHSERDGKMVYRADYSSLVRAWDLTSGNLLRTYQCTPPHGIRSMYLTPNGKYFLTLDETPGEFTDSLPRALTLWDTATGKYRQVERGNAIPGAFTSDRHLVAVRVPTAKNESDDAAIKICAVPDWQEVCNITADDRLTKLRANEFASNDKVLVGVVQKFDKSNDWENSHESLTFWDVKSGQELFSIPGQAPGEAFAWVEVSPDGQTVVANAYKRFDDNNERILIVDIPMKQSKFVDLPTNTYVGRPVFHPSGRWFVVLTMPKNAEGDDDDLPPEECPQPRLLIVGVPEGKILETLVAPQANVPSAAFNPDGTLLATSGYGKVLLWDFHAPPGTSSPNTKPTDWLDKVTSLEGPLVGGNVLDWRDFKEHVVLVDFWATSCLPCVADLPKLKSLEAKYRDHGLKVIGVSLDDDLTQLAQFVKDRPMPWPTICKPASASNVRHPLAVKFGVDAVPVMMLIDRHGRVTRIGSRLSEFDDDLEALLAK
jgi:WD40 repeat protein